MSDSPPDSTTTGVRAPRLRNGGHVGNLSFADELHRRLGAVRGMGRYRRRVVVGRRDSVGSNQSDDAGSEQNGEVFLLGGSPRTRSPDESTVIRGRLVLIVSDSGPGISKRNQPRLFKEGVQFNAHKLQAGGGSGFG